jgi:ubiquinone biosynthesis protein
MSDVLRAIPLPAPAPAPEPAPIPSRFEARRPSVLQRVGRALKWYSAMGRLAARMAADRAAGRASLQADARHLRRAFEEVGGTALKLGQQLSIRVDLLPWELCDELASLTDRVPAFPVEEAITAVEEAIGGPLDGVFAEFQREPIGSASIACVYRARLHDGSWVAVKVRRPHVVEQFACDLANFGWMTRTSEALTRVRPGFFAPLREALTSMFSEELDLRTEARYQAIFARYAREARLKWLTCPGVYRQWSTERVLISEFVDGVPFATLLRAVEKRDPEAKARIDRERIDPELVARRLFYTSLWARMEAPLFHGDPHPANLIVLPDSRICLIDFGACGVTSRPRAALQLQVLRHLTEHEVGLAAKTSFAQLAPLPAIDADALARELEARLWRYAQGIRDPDGAWYERTSAAVFLAMMEATRKFELPVNIDMLRVVRSSMLYDTLSNRLGRAHSQDDVRRYLRDHEKRRARKRRRRARSDRWTKNARIRRIDEARRTLERAKRRLAHLALQMPHMQQQAGILSAAAREATVLLGAGALALVVALVADVPGLTSPAGLLGLLLAGCVAGQRFRHRLRELR